MTHLRNSGAAAPASAPASAAPAMASAPPWRLVTLELTVVALSLPFAIALAHGGDVSAITGSLPSLGRGMAQLVLIFAFFAWSLGLHRTLWRYVGVADILVLVQVATATAVAFAMTTFLARNAELVTEAVMVVHWLVLLALLCALRLGHGIVMRDRLTRRLPLHAEWRPVLLVGAGDGAAALIQLANQDQRVPYTIVGILDERPEYRGRVLQRVPVLGRPAELPQIVARLAVHGVPVRMLVRSGCAESAASLEALYEAAGRLDLPVCDTADFMRVYASKLAAGKARESTAAPKSSRAKRAIDVLVAAVLIVLTLPTFLLIMGLVYLFLGRPIFFGQIRPGYRRRPMTVYKFRTMHFGHLLTGDLTPDRERMSRFGSLLRRTRLDELPQLWSVLNGDMSLIGPRPLLPADLPPDDELLDERFSMRPGITGWAQVHGGQNLDAHTKMALDLWYVRNYSLWLDLRIVVMTLLTIVFGDDKRQQATHSVANELARSSGLRRA